MLLLDRLQEILILHRKLDYADEDATLEEQSEKILYFYSSNLDARDIKEQLSIATLSEALIELTNKFSNEPIQTVVMHRKFWTFMECEPGIWIIIAFINNSEAITSAKYNPNNITSDQVMTTDVYHSFIKNFYSLYYSMNGSIQSFLVGSHKNGLKVIDNIMALQKKIRKIKKRLSIKESDINKAELDENAFIPESNESLNDIQTELHQTQQQFNELLMNPEYTLPFLRAKLSNFIQWYLYQENLNNISVFSSIRPLISDVEDRKTKYCSSAITRLITAVKHALPELKMKCVVSYENKLLWSDLDHTLTNRLLEFLYRCDHTIKVGSTNRRLRLATEEFTRSLFQENRCDYPTFDTHHKEKLFQALKGKETRIQGRYGVFLINGQTVNLDNYLTVLLQQQAQSNLTPSNSTVGTDNTMVSSDDAELLARTLSTDGFRFDDKTVIYSPKIYNSKNDSNHDNEENDLSPGRLLQFYFGKMSISLIIEENDDYYQFKQQSVQSILEQPPNGMVARRIKLSYLYDIIFNPSTSTTLPSNTSTTPNIPTASDVRRMQMLLLCYIVQRTVRGELEKIETNDWNKYFFTNTTASTVIVGGGGSGLGGGSVGIASGSTGLSGGNAALSVRGFQSISAAPSVSTSSVSSAALSTGGTASIASSSIGGGVPSISSALGGGGSTGTGEYINPTTIRGLVLPKAIHDRDCKVFYFTDTFAGIKLYDRDNGDVTLPFFLLPDVNNDIRAIAANSLTPTTQASPALPSKVIDSVFDQYFYQQMNRGPFAAIFFQCLTHCYGLATMKALIDIWSELQRTADGVKNFDNKRNESDASKLKKFVVTRVSALQRGGVWVVGKRLFTGQCLYVVVNQCSTLYEVMDVVDNVIKSVTKR